MNEKRSSVALGVVALVLFFSVMGAWWYTVAENRRLVQTVAELKQQMVVVQKHLAESRQLYEALDEIKQEVRHSRSGDR